MATLKNKALSRFNVFSEYTLGIFEKYANLESDKLKQKPANSGWSILQVLEHLQEAESKSISYLMKKSEDYSGVKKKSFSTILRASLLRLALKSSKKFKAPSALGEPNNTTEISTLRNEFKQHRAAIQDLITNLPPEAFELELFRHPTAGRITVYQMLGFMQDHWTHHVSQMERILKTP